MTNNPVTDLVASITPEERALVKALHDAEHAWNCAAKAIIDAGLEIETSNMSIDTLRGEEPIIHSAVSKVVKINC